MTIQNMIKVKKLSENICKLLGYKLVKLDKEFIVISKGTTTKLITYSSVFQLKKTLEHVLFVEKIRGIKGL